jgi:DnaJ-class molecular chaperone
MPSLDCPRCDGSGQVQEDGATPSICMRCEGTGVVFVDEGAGDALPQRCHRLTSPTS